MTVDDYRQQQPVCSRVGVACVLSQPCFFVIRKLTGSEEWYEPEKRTQYKMMMMTTTMMMKKMKMKMTTSSVKYTLFQVPFW